jgi:hypothetical protein
VSPPARVAASNRPQGQVGVDDRPESRRVPQPHARADCRHAELRRTEAPEPDAPSKLHVAASELGPDPVETDAVLVELHLARDGVEGVRQREVPQTSVGDGRTTVQDGAIERPPEIDLQLGGARAPDIPEEALQDAEVGVAQPAQGETPLLEIDVAGHLELRTLAHHPQRLDLHPLVFEHQPDGPVVAHAVVDQSEIRLLEPGGSAQRLGSRHVAKDAHGAAADQGGQW